MHPGRKRGRQNNLQASILTRRTERQTEWKDKQTYRRTGRQSILTPWLTVGENSFHGGPFEPEGER